MMTSMDGSSEALVRLLRSDWVEDRVPFIFQLPATMNLRGVSIVRVVAPLKGLRLEEDEWVIGEGGEDGSLIRWGGIAEWI